jgi:hypothetical protein
MAAPKGHPRYGGRTKGTKNKVTKEARETLSNIIEGEVDNIRESLAEVKKEDHYKYLSILEKLMCYAIPKRRDVTTDGESIRPIINISEHRSDPPAK